MWDDVLLSDVSADKIPSNITLQVWHEISGVKNLTSRGYDVVVSLSDFCILIVVTLGGSQTILDMLKPQKTLTLTQVKEEVGVDL